ncbi:Pyrroline-5-carboxylate reductase [uncultured archaeon]|nr:Pyrroline-5-carboxylate reductase [uncultured archaeon]
MIGIIGFGKMGRAIADGLAKKGFQVMVKDKEPLGLSSMKEAKSLAEMLQCSAIIIAVKPKDVEPLLREIKAAASSQQPLFISIAAGKTLSYFESILGARKIIRAMPNLSARVGKSATCFCANSQVETADIAIAKEIFSSIGICLQVEESQLDAVTALSGSGPAYYFYFTQKLAEAGVSAGLDAKTALTLARQVLSGSALLSDSSGKSLEEMVKEVATPGGTTEAALSIFDKEKIPAIFGKALKAARERSKEQAKK